MRLYGVHGIVNVVKLRRPNGKRFAIIMLLEVTCVERRHRDYKFNLCFSEMKNVYLYNEQP